MVVLMFFNYGSSLKIKFCWSDDLLNIVTSSFDWHLNNVLS